MAISQKLRPALYFSFGFLVVVLSSALLAITPGRASASVTRTEIEAALSSVPSNSVLGDEALASATIAKDDAAFGSRALSALTEGEDDIAVGPSTLVNLNGKASKDIAVGVSALQEATTAESNVAVGNTALFSDTSGSENVAVGNIAEFRNTSGRRNTAVGREALAEGTTAEKNTGVGFNALGEDQTGSENTAVGVNSLDSPTIPHASISHDTAVGFNAGTKTEGSGDVYLGWEAGAKFTGSNELFIANSQTATPLIFGNFEAKTASINGTLEVTESPTQPPKPAAGEIGAGPAKMVARKSTFAIVGNGAKTKWSLTHHLDTRLVTISVQVGESEEPGEVESSSNYKVKPTSSAEVEVVFNVAPSAGKEYFVTVVG